MNSPEVKQFIQEQKNLFWSIRKDKLEDISHDTLVEFILNFGNEKAVKKLFDLLGVDYVAEIFYKSTLQNSRAMYYPLIVNFFNLYFARHASKEAIQRAKEYIAVVS